MDEVLAIALLPPDAGAGAGARSPPPIRPETPAREIPVTASGPAPGARPRPRA